MSGNIIKKLLQPTGIQIVLLIITCGFLLGPAGSALSATISGTVSLPSGDTAPAGGINVDINANNQNGSGYGSSSVTIAEGQSSATYSMTVPDDTNASWKVNYYYGGNEYYHYGNYFINGTTWHNNDFTVLAGGQNFTGIDLELINNKTIDGTISLPSGQTAPTGGLNVTIMADAGDGIGYGDGFVIIGEGETSTTYSLNIPDDLNVSWKIVYYNDVNDYLHYGYYSSSGTTWDESAATLLPGGQDYANINLVLLEGNTISGTVSLPSGDTAPVGGIRLTIYSHNQQGTPVGAAYNLIINEGQSSTSYTLHVPNDTNISNKISYSCGENDYLHYGYYSSSGTTWDESAATLLPGGQDHANINLVLLTSNTISGTVSLPSGDTAPAGGINVIIYANNQNGNGGSSSSVTIAEGESSASYSMTVPDDPNASWSIQYYYGGNDYLSYGYYSSSGTTWDSSAATLLPGGQDHTNINLVLLEGNTISGTVSLPSGDTAPAGGINVDINASNQNGRGYSYSSVTIAEGESSASYSMTVPDDPNASWSIQYYYGGNDYLFYGYYSSSGTTWDSSAATLLPGGQDHTNIDLVLLEGNTISGTVSLPSGDTAPSGGIRVSLYANNQNGSGYGFSSVTIAEGQTSATYSIRVPDDPNASWRIRYSYYGGNDYLSYGYYSSSGTTWDYSAATLLPGGQNHTNIDLVLLRAKTISGTITLPSGQTASDSICFDVYAKSTIGEGSVRGYDEIQSGGSAGDYSISIPTDTGLNWTVSYERTSCWWNSTNSDDSYWGLGYYSSSSTVLHAVDATQLAGGSDHSDIDMTVFEGNTISGTISLPNGQVAKEDIVLFVRAQVSGTPGNDPMHIGYGYGYGYGYGPMTFAETAVYRTVVIAKGSSSADYTLTISPETGINWTVFYSCDSCGKKYQDTGYYSTSGTVGKVSGTTPVAGASDHSNINLTLLKKKGMLCFPVRSKDGQISIISM